MRQKQNQFQRQRSQLGQALAEGAAALVLIVTMTILGCLFIANTGLLTYYTQRLGFVADQAALYAYNLQYNQTPSPSAATVHADTTSYVQYLMNKMGMPTTSVTIPAPATGSVNGKPTVSVTISDKFSLLGQKGIFPAIIPLSITSVAGATTYIISGPQGPAGATGPAGSSANGSVPGGGTISGYVQVGSSSDPHVVGGSSNYLPIVNFPQGMPGQGTTMHQFLQGNPNSFTGANPFIGPIW